MSEKVVGYLRRSTTKQEQSLEGQRGAIESYAATKNYNVDRWYIDDGISGSSGEQRPQFLQLIEDAQRRRDFSAVIVYDLSRFGRMAADETGHYRFLLKEAGVRIEFSNESDGGDGETGEILRPVLQAQKRQYLRQLSRDTLRGQIQSAQAGWASGRAAPFGYDRMLVDTMGVHQKRLKRGEKFAKDRSWRVALVPSNTPGEVQHVQWIFNTYLELEVGIREIARQLNEKGVKSPRGGDWCIGTVRDILRNPVYKGELCFGRRAMGEFHRHEQGHAQAVGMNSRSVTRRPRDKWIVNKKPELALVSAETWDAVNSRLASRGDRSRAARARSYTYLLSGLIQCGHCGAVMVGAPRSGQRRYFCSSFFKAKKCACNSVCEVNLVEVLREMIDEKIFQFRDLDALRSQVIKEAKRLPAFREDNRKSVQKKLDEVRANLDRAVRNLALTSPENVSMVDRVVSELRQEAERLGQELATEPSRPDPEAMADEIVKNARGLLEGLESDNPSRLKAVLSALVQKIELKFGNAQWGKRTVREVTGCEVSLHSATSFTTNGRGDSRCMTPNELWWLSARVLLK